jgi:hypothetical protein
MNSNNKIYYFLLILGALIYAVVVPLHWSEAYIDVGDGNYMYISMRMTQGQVLYRDIMAPQPPVHLCIGYSLVRIANVFGFHPLYAFRAFSLIAHLGTYLLIFLLGLRLFKHVDSATVAALLYLFLPEGFWWSLGYQSEPTEIIFLLLSLYFILSEKKSSLVLAAVFSMLAVFTNMTAAPYVLFTALYLLVRRRKICLYYIIPLALLVGLGVTVSEMLTGAYFDNVIFNQVGTFPQKEIGGETAIQYAIRKIPTEFKDVVVWEGVIILLSVFGLFIFLAKSQHPLKEYIGWFTFFSWCSIIFVAKGGTMDYIFTLGEPYVALFAGYFCTWFFGKIRTVSPYGSSRPTYWQDTTPFLRPILFVFMLILMFFVGGRFVVGTLKQQTFEILEGDTRKIKYYINKYSNPGDMILAPPYFAFLTGRTLIEEYSEIYIWYIKYWNETILFKEPGEGVKKVKLIAESLKNHELPIVVLDLRMTGSLPEVKEAINKYYKPLIKEPFQTLNTQMHLFVPNKDNQEIKPGEGENT